MRRSRWPGSSRFTARNTLGDVVQFPIAWSASARDEAEPHGTHLAGTPCGGNECRVVDHRVGRDGRGRVARLRAVVAVLGQRPLLMFRRKFSLTRLPK